MGINDGKKRFGNFFFPGLSRNVVIRMICVAVITYLIFTFIFIPLKIKGHSMAPTYNDGHVNICFRLAYFFSTPKRFDVVVVRYAGARVMLLKRIVALEGETVEFRAGQLFVNGRIKKEPYGNRNYHWNLGPRKVEKGNVYLVGDNRSAPMFQHDFGQTSIRRIIGAPLW